MQKSELEITSKSEQIEILKNGKYTSIALCNNNEPYIITLTYGYDPDAHALYFHTGTKGLKLELLESNSRVCATVIEDHGYKMTECEQHYRSLVFWGKLVKVDGLEEKKHGMQVLLNHLEDEPESIKKRLLYEDSRYNKFAILRLDIGEMTGKDGLRN
jgi:nitroimidazol reductase NimA-like FMN-containing flavoprotein (pyridoxamine 5'-phosphate oxidase superfamily)